MNGKQAAADISALLRARNPLLRIITREEERTERLLMESGQAANYEPVFWDCANGVTDYAGNAIDSRMTDPAVVLGAIRDSNKRQAWILRDMNPWLKDPTVCRMLRSLARNLTLAPRDTARAVILLTPSMEYPAELEPHTITVDWPLPDRAEVAAILDSAIESLPDDLKASAAPNGTRDSAIDAALGLTQWEAQACFSKSLVSLKRIDPATVANEKKRVIAKEKLLEFIDPIAQAFAGYSALQAWTAGRKKAFTAKARTYGLPRPKGVLLVGQPGCGKSLFAKTIATAWGMPCLKLDLGALKSKWQGESGTNLRKALNTAAAVAPCVLWIDEVDKGLAGSDSSAADGGTQADFLGTILTWQQEQEGVFVVATANSVEGLAPALLRKGRFDELFFVDLPNATERAEVLRAAILAHKRNPDNFDFPAIAAKTQDFTGSEIAALVPEAMYAAFSEDREFITPDLLIAAANTIPLSKTAQKSVEDLRKWAQGRAKNASITTSKQNRALDI